MLRPVQPISSGERVCGGYRPCQHPKSSAYFEEYQLILVIPLLDSEELPLSVLSSDSLPGRRERNAGEFGVTDNFFDYGYSLLTIEDGRQR